ncbi:hypothetical protein EDD15DRAFT_2366477 [Pisolithus albus]|nr:hypothetical protein EDD15DRAFT_2366477 [Pisolithus albus]
MSMRAAPSIDRVRLQVCDSVLVTVLMAKSCTKKRATPQVADGLQPALNDLVVGSDARKKAKTVPSADDQTRRSSRANKGSGGQIAQLQNIERIQTQAVARVSPMDVATANEPRNPLAPPSDKQLPQRKTRRSNGRAEEKIPSDAPVRAPTASVGGNTLLRPTRQVPIPGSRYGFRLPTPAADSATSCGDSTVPHRSASAIQSSRQSSTHPASRGRSATPVSRGGTPITMPTPPVPLRSSQIVQRAYNSQTRQLSRTFSVRDLNTASQPQNFFDQDVSVPAPPPYYHAGEDGDTECVDDHDSFPSQRGKFPISGDTDIDDISPDEDERTAEAALHTPEPDSRSQGANVNSVNSRASTPELGQFYHGEDNQDSRALPATRPADSQIDPALLAISEQHHGEDSDVVRAYHQRNGFPHVPAPERLRAIRDQQQPSSGIAVSMPAQDVACGVAQSSQLPPESTGPPTTVLLTADGELTGHPTKLRSYPNKFREVIERAKLIAQCDSATKNPFPSRSTFLDIMSGEIFNEALVECTNTPPGYWPNYRSQLGILLWESLMTWRSTIKAKAREVLPRFYDVGAHCTEAENQSQSQALIKGAMFLRDGVDNEGSTNNMAHPALAALVSDFFYSSSSIGAVFPEVFSREVPRVAVCLAATALRAALDEYTQTGIRQDRPFEYGTYSKIFAGFLDMQHQIDQHPRHAAKTRELRVAWASAGRCETARRNVLPASTHPKDRMKTQLQPVIAFSDEFHVILD